MQNGLVKVMFVVDYYAGPTGGTEGQLFTLIEGLDKRVFEPRMAVFRPTPFVSGGVFPCPVQVLNMEARSLPGALFEMWKWSRYIKVERINIVHTYFNGAAIYAPFFSKIAGAKVISSRRDMGFW